MAYKGYLGPAGLFSTDDPIADQRQIEAEQYDPEEWEQEDPLHEGEETRLEEMEEKLPPMIEAYVGSTDCKWWNMETIEYGTYDAWMERMKAKHQKQCGCNAELSFSHS